MIDSLGRFGKSLVRCACAAVLLAILTEPAPAAWRSTGPYGGDAEVIRMVPKAKGYVIAGAHDGLLFTSTNGGASWNNLRFPAQFGATLHALEVDPTTPATWYAGTESENAWLSGVYKTQDEGKTWNLLEPTKGFAVWSIALWPGDSHVIAAGTAAGVYLSHDAGATWEHVSPPNDPEIRPVVSLAFDPKNVSVIYAGTTHLPWRTTDGGKTWNSIHEGMLDDSDVFSIQVDPAQPQRVFASACSGVYASRDGAEQWRKLETPHGAFRTHFVALDPKNAEIVFAGTTEGLLRSTDSGRSWRNVSGQSIKSIAFDPFVDGRIFFASTTAGLMVSTDSGATLHDINVGFTNRNFTTLTGSGLDLYSSSVYEGSSGGAYRTNNYGLRWMHTGTPSGDQILLMSAAPDDPKVLFGAGYHSLLQSNDYGKTWVAKKAPAGSHITALLTLSANSVFVATDRGLFRTASDGASWIQCAVGQIVLLHGAPKKMFSALTAYGALASEDGVSWKSCGQPQGNPHWYGIDFDSADSGVALAATSAGLFRSTDRCRSWSPAVGGLRPETVSIVIFHPTHAGEAFVSQNGRVFRTTDGGQQWLAMNDDAQGNSGPSSLVVLPAAPDLLFALFPRRGVFSTYIKEN